MMKHKIQFYSILGTMLSAGLPVKAALMNPLPGAVGKAAPRMLQQVLQGKTLSDAMRQEKRLFSAVEIALIHVGEMTGSLEQAAQALREMFEQRLALHRSLLTGLAYPMFIYIAAGPLLKIIELATASVTSGQSPEFASWGGAIALRCLLWWGVPVLLWMLGSTLAGTLLGGRLAGRLLAAIPWFGSLYEDYSSATFWRTLGVCLAAGVGPVVGIRLAASSCSSAWNAARLKRMAEAIEQQGMTFAQAFATVATPHEQRRGDISMMTTAEMSGTLDRQAKLLAQTLSQSIETSFARLATLLPLVVFLLLALYLAYNIISAYVGIFSSTTGGLL